jgi:hypothetical protein
MCFEIKRTGLEDLCEIDCFAMHRQELVSYGYAQFGKKPHTSFKLDNTQLLPQVCSSCRVFYLRDVICEL